MATHTARHSSSSRALVALALATTIATAGFGPERAQADAASEARQRYERAIKFYEEGVYDAALVELTRAYELNPSFRIVYNIAQTRLAMRDYAGAIEAFQRYLREGGGKVTNDRVASVRAQLDDLQQRVGKLTVETDVPDSEVLVDDVVVGNSPLPPPLAVNAGMRRVSVRHPDYPTQSQRVSVAGGEQLRMTLYLRPRGAEPPPAVVAPKTTNEEAVAVPAAPPPARTPARALGPTDSEPAADEPSRALAIVATGATVALATTAVVLGVVTINKDDELDEKRDRPDQNDAAAFDQERSDLRRLAALTDAFTIATIAAAGVTAWLWLRDDGEDAETADRARGSGVRLSLGPASAQLSGEF